MLNERQERLCEESRWDFSNLSALFLNCTLKRSPELSHTEGLIRISQAIKDGGGIPAHGNQRSAWDAGCRFDHPNPLYR